MAGTSRRAPGQGIVSFTADATITDGQVVLQGASDNSCRLPTGATDTGIVLGIAKVEGGGSIAANQGVDVVLDGVQAATASGAIAKGDRVCIANSSGNVKKAGYGVFSAGVVGYALEAAASGEKVAVLIVPNARPNLVIEAFTSDGACTANYAVKVGGANDKVAIATADPVAGLVGVALNTTADGETVYVCISGVVPVVSVSNITRGTNVTIGTGGAVKPSAPSTGVNAQNLGTAMSSATAPATANILVTVNMMQGA